MSTADDAVELWKNFKEEQPKLAFALSVLPVTGQVAAAVEYYDAMKRGDTADGIAAAVQFGAGALGAKAGKAIIKAGEEVMATARAGIGSGAYLGQAGGDLSAASRLYGADKAVGARQVMVGRATGSAVDAGTQAAEDLARGYATKPRAINAR